ncbi:MAG: hypothetical protein JNK77_04110 [Saprospiraceae bacterium]|nr:hypothetical protein [Saprospiraceae bacterium]
MSFLYKDTFNSVKKFSGSSHFPIVVAGFWPAIPLPAGVVAAEEVAGGGGGLEGD